MAIAFVSAPALAQTDLSGNWGSRMHEDWADRAPGPDVVDYLGMPLTDGARARALSYTASQLSMPERQCLYYPPYYVVLGPQGLKIWSETDPVTGEIVAWKLSAAIDRDIVTIWMDGRPHPGPYDSHPYSGFTTGEWRGNTLTAYTTHMKEGFLRRNGVPSSDQATATMHLTRFGDTLTITAFIVDPANLTEPYVLSRSWQREPDTEISPVAQPCVPEAEVAGLTGEGQVPHYLPGKNPYAEELSKAYNLPVEAAQGGAETMYPEFRKRMEGKYQAPAKCTRYCCGWVGGRTPNETTMLGCIGRPF